MNNTSNSNYKVGQFLQMVKAERVQFTGYYTSIDLGEYSVEKVPDCLNCHIISTWELKGANRELIEVTIYEY